VTKEVIKRDKKEIDAIKEEEKKLSETKRESDIQKRKNDGIIKGVSIAFGSITLAGIIYHVYQNNYSPSALEAYNLRDFYATLGEVSKHLYVFDYAINLSNEPLFYLSLRKLTRKCNKRRQMVKTWTSPCL